MVVALIIVSLLLYATVYAFFADGAARRGHGDRRALAWTALALIVVTLGQVVIGTQVREGIDLALDAGVLRGRALASVGRLDTWHRELSLLVIVVTAGLSWLVWTRHAAERALVRATGLVALLVGLQVVLGLSMAYLALTPPAQVAHLTTSSLLLGGETLVFLLARWLPAD